MKESLAKMRMEDLKRAREEFEFHGLTTEKSCRKM